MWKTRLEGKQEIRYLQRWGISRQKPCETGAGSKGKSKTEESAAWGTGNNKSE